MQILTENNFLIYCAQNYTNTTCTSTDEFLDDLKRIRYIKKLFRQHKEKGPSSHRIRLILNHVITLYNVFDSNACTKILFFKLEDHWDCLSPILLYLGYLPQVINGIENEDMFINTREIGEDLEIKQILRTDY